MRTTRSTPKTKGHADRSASAQPWLIDSFAAAWSAGKQVAALPFDALRASHAGAVNAGLVPNSILESRDFEHAVEALERVMLGPLARHT